MPIYRITDPITGKKVKLTGEAPPTEMELNEIFSTLNVPEQNRPEPAQYKPPDFAQQIQQPSAIPEPQQTISQPQKYSAPVSASFQSEQPSTTGIAPDYQQFEKEQIANKSLPGGILTSPKALAVGSADILEATGYATDYITRKSQKSLSKSRPMQLSKRQLKLGMLEKTKTTDIDPMMAKIAQKVSKQIPEKWKKEVGAVSGQGITSERTMKDPAGVLNTIFTQAANTAPLIAEQAVISSIGAVALPGFGAVVGGGAAMMMTEMGNFLKSADVMKDGLSEPQKKQWQDIVDKYAPAYGVASGMTEYAGNATGVLGATKDIGKKLILKDLFKRVAGIIGEGVEELSQTALMNTLMGKAIEDMKQDNPDFAPDWKPDSKWDAFKSGVAVSALFSGASTIAQKMVEPSPKEAQTETPMLADELKKAQKQPPEVDRINAENAALRQIAAQQPERGVAPNVGKQPLKPGEPAAEPKLPEAPVSQEQGQGIKPEPETDMMPNTQRFLDKKQGTPKAENVPKIDESVPEVTTEKEVSVPRETESIADMSTIGYSDRVSYRQDLEESTKDAVQNKKNVSHAAIDMINMGAINESFNHETANEILINLATTFKNSIESDKPENSTIKFYRPGKGDEFAVIANGLNKDELGVLVKKAQDEVTKVINSKKYTSKTGKDISLTELVHPKHDNLETGAGYFSVGVSDFEETRDIKKMVNLADSRATDDAKDNISGIANKSIDKRGVFIYNTNTGRWSREDSVIGKIIGEKTRSGEWKETDYNILRQKAKDEISKGGEHEYHGQTSETAGGIKGSEEDAGQIRKQPLEGKAEKGTRTEKEITPSALVESKTEKELNEKLDSIFGNIPEERLEELDNGADFKNNEEELIYNLSTEHRADLEHAAYQRDHRETEEIFNYIKTRMESAAKAIPSAGGKDTDAKTGISRKVRVKKEKPAQPTEEKKEPEKTPLASAIEEAEKAIEDLEEWGLNTPNVEKQPKVRKALIAIAKKYGVKRTELEDNTIWKTKKKSDTGKKANKKSEMYRKGYDNFAVSFAYIPDFKNEQEKIDFEAGAKDGFEKKNQAPVTKKPDVEKKPVEAAQEKSPVAKKDEKLTPLLRKYKDTKKLYPDNIILFKSGDYYEALFDDANIVSKELSVTLTQDSEKNSIAGFSIYNLDRNVKKLVQAGYKIAVVENAPIKQEKPVPKEEPKATEKKEQREEKEKPTKQKEATSEIKDFGTKIGGARKDYFSEYSDRFKDAQSSDMITESLSESWPEPNYEKLVEGKTDPYIVAVIRILRDIVPSKPRQPFRVKRWADSAKQLRDLSQQLISGEISKKTFEEKLDKDPILKDKIGGTLELYKIFGHSKSLKGITLQKHHYSLYKGEKDVTKWIVEKSAPSTAFSNMPRELGVGNTKEEAIEDFREKYDSLTDAKKDKKKTEFIVYQNRKTKKYHVGKKITPRKYLDLKEFETVKEALDYRKNNQAELEALLKKTKENPNERREFNRERIGKDHRNGKDVTPDMFENSFGFRGVEFGNWVNNDERQDNLNRAYDALYDLANILNIPTRAISLNGELGLGFGSRGHGGKNAPSAHYEPSKVVINLTKKNGAGSLAHEWWHAFDNYISRVKGKKTGYITEDTAFNDKIRKELAESFKKIVDSINETKLKERSIELDKSRSKDYWSTTIEMAARSFENYIIDKLNDMGANNDYLANVATNKEYAKDLADSILFGTNRNIDKEYPYLLSDELPAVKTAFEELFSVIKTRKEGKNVALFSKQLSESTESNPITFEDAKEIAKAKIPKALWDKAIVRLRPTPGKTQGAIYVDGNTLMVDISPDTPSNRLVDVIFHDIMGHAGAANVLKSNPQIHKRLKALYETSTAKIQRETILKNYKEEYDKKRESGKSELDIENETFAEWIAHNVERYNRTKEKTGLPYQIWKAIKEFLIGMGWKNDSISEAMETLVQAIRKTTTFEATIGIESGGIFSKGEMFAKEQAPADPFFSPTLRAVQGLKQERGTGEQMFNMIVKAPGVKEAEWKWMGLDDFLLKPTRIFEEPFDPLKALISEPKYKKQFTKAEIEEFVRQNQVEIKEVSKERGKVKYYPKNSYMHPQTGDVDTYENWESVTEDFSEEGGKTKDEQLDTLIDVSGKPIDNEDLPDPTKYSSLQLPGATNYREMVLTLPVKTTDPGKPLSQEERKEYDDLLDAQASSARGLSGEDDARLQELAERAFFEKPKPIGQRGIDFYKSSHWDELNVIAHTRMNDRTGPGGEKVLFVEEIQSDWAREAREKGILGTMSPKYEVRELPDNPGFYAAYNNETQSFRGLGMEKYARRDLAEDIVSGLNGAVIGQRGVPNQPFLKNWEELTLKRVLRMAAEEGYDRVAWINGEQTADRYDLSKQISKVVAGFEGAGNYNLTAYDKTGNKVISEVGLDESKLADYVGKDLAQKIINDKGGKYSGIDLKIGGEWAVNLYDRMIPKFYEKYGKKWGVKVEPIRILTEKKRNTYGYDVVPTDHGWEVVDGNGNNVTDQNFSSRNDADKWILTAKEGGSIQQSIRITEEMRQSVMYEGQPMFAKELQLDPTGVPIESTMDKIRQKVQDRFLRLERLQNALNPNISEEMDARLAQELYNGRAEARLDEFERKHFKPLRDKISDSKIKLDELEDFLYAQHAAERNEHIKNIRPKETEKFLTEQEMDLLNRANEIGYKKAGEPDAVKVEKYDRQLEGIVSELKNLNVKKEKIIYTIAGSGMFTTKTDKDAAIETYSALDNEGLLEEIKAMPVAEEILNKFKDEGKTDKLKSLASDVYDITDRVRNVLLSEGLIDEETKKAWESYEFYVPLRGIKDEKQTPRTGRGFDIRGKESKRALGRKSKAQNVLANIIVQANEAVIRAEKNRVGRAFLNFVQANPNEELWTVDEAKKMAFFNERTGEVEYRIDPKYRLSENIMSVKVDGKEYHIAINDDTLAKAMVNLGAEKSNKVLQGLSMLNRYFALINTSLVPEFVLTNLSRDLQTAMINSGAEYDVKTAGRILKTVPSAIKWAWEGEADRDSEGAKWYNEYKQSGGKIGFFGLESVDDVSSKIKSELALMEGGIKENIIKGARAATSFIMKANGAIENASRLATYIEMRKKGLSKAKAASIARNITVDFNKSGELGPYFKALFVFSNASIQGTARTLKALKNPRTQAVAAGIVAGSIALAELGRLVGGKDDDDEYFYDKIPGFIKQNNIVFMTTKGDIFFKIPVPYGFNIFHAFGQSLDYVIHNNKKGDFLKEASNVAGAVGNSFNPLGSASNILQMLTPTAARPITDISLNKDFMGNPVYKVDKYGIPKAQSSTHFKGTSIPAKGIAKGLNVTTGGGEYERGIVDLPPDVIDYIFDFYTGGLGKTVKNALSLPLKIGTKKDVTINEIPFVRRFVGEISEYQDINTFYENVNRAETIRKEYEAKKRDNPTMAAKYYEKNKDILILTTKVGIGEGGRETTPINNMEKKIKSLRKIKDALENAGKLKLAKEYEEKIISEIKMYNRTLNKIGR